ncbi:MarR family winged helix-turn-helix transcriptional regulator [Arthrobacter sp. H14-L1]|uniref:MarR family winged helix-turn-helix transcriptional regulator n=1 Tax=Arthrobacter sp. H14-L1 TaxID=2996697 RepID=UPI00226DF9B6|nr:MarR family winged helix-turn-helix transcriptional regulator [Arthrobacter sp. H14-L1]MCY0905887.1 MarR family winged helix-turn-helix transcriptional regulator [Arthrobacter sp. H14-L1]
MATQRPLGFWLKLVDGLINQQFDGLVEEHGVTRPQWQIMNVLAENPSSETELTNVLQPFFDSTVSVSAAEPVTELLESGWVEFDGERYSLTGLGHDSLLRLGEVVEHQREKITKNIPAEEYEAALDVLQRMARNLGWRE